MVLAIGREFNDMSQIIAVMITIFVIGLLFDRIIFLRLEEKGLVEVGVKPTYGIGKIACAFPRLPVCR